MSEGAEKNSQHLIVGYTKFLEELKKKIRIPGQPA